MSKRAVLMVLAVGIGLATLQGATAEAGWTYVRPPGTWWYYGSIDGCALVSQVRNPEQFPAQFSCEVEVTEVQTLCENPENHKVSPGEAATQVVFVGTNQIDDDDLLNSKDQKNKGKASLCVSIEDNDCSIDPVTGEPRSPLCDPQYCVNPNWHPLDVLTTAFRAKCTTEQCTGDDPDNPCDETVLWDTQVCECRLPAGYSVESKPSPCPKECLLDPLAPSCSDSCVAYECFELNKDTLQPTGQACAFQQ
jgi:hypothetical protein